MKSEGQEEIENYLQVHAFSRFKDKEIFNPYLPHDLYRGAGMTLEDIKPY